MGGTFSRSWAMTKESWAVLRSDKTLVLFPLISSAALIGVVATFAVPTIITLVDAGLFEEGARHDQPISSGTQAILAVIAFAYYFVSFTVMNFFNVALVGAAMERFAGREAGVQAGLRIAVQRIPQILLWSALAATVGMVLKMIEERVRGLGRIATALLGTAWAIATFFVVPVLAAEGVGPITALKRSVAVLRKSWGEAAVTRIGVGAVFTVLLLLVILGGAVAVTATWVLTQSVAGAIAVGAVVVLAVLGLSLVSTTLQTILQAAVYTYAANDRVPQGFQPETLRGVFQRK